MISIAFSTRINNESFINHLKKQQHYDNEIVQYINNGERSLTEVYNDFLTHCKYDIVLFLHDDVLLPVGFDKILIEKFNNSDHGILGVAGTTSLTKTGVWWSERQFMTGNVYHVHKGNKTLSSYTPKNNYINDVLVIDGVFIAINKTKIKSNFNEEMQGFHFYDVSFCVDNYLKGVKIGVIHMPQFTHFSIGEIKEDFHNAKSIFLEKYDNLLPIHFIPEISHIENTKIVNEKTAIIIPSKNNYDILKKCVDSINLHSNNHNIYIADTGSDPEVLSMVDTLDVYKVIKYDYYNFAKINNNVVKYHLSDEKYLIFCNDDVELLNNVIGCYTSILTNNEKCGTVGCRLYYPNKMLQHAGIKIIRKQNQFDISHAGLKTYHNAYVNENIKVIGNTGALMGVKKSLYLKYSGFNENTVECFEDVLFNLILLKNGYNNIFCGRGVALHHESLTRNKSKLKNQNSVKDYTDLLLPEIIKNFNFYKKYIQ